MLRVMWPSDVDVQAEVWRILDLSGMTKSVRESMRYTRAGYLYLNGNRVQTLKDTVATSTEFVLELRFPNGISKRNVIFLVPVARQSTQRVPGGPSTTVSR